MIDIVTGVSAFDEISPQKMVAIVCFLALLFCQDIAYFMRAKKQLWPSFLACYNGLGGLSCPSYISQGLTVANEMNIIDITFRT